MVNKSYGQKNQKMMCSNFRSSMQSKTFLRCRVVTKRTLGVRFCSGDDLVLVPSMDKIREWQLTQLASLISTIE